MLPVGIGVLIGAVATGRAEWTPRKVDNLFVEFSMPFPYFFALVVTHLKEQLASPRSALIPGYRAAHIIVAGLLVAPIFTFVPAMVSLALHAPLIGPAGFVFAFFALAGWGLYMGNAIRIVAVLVWFSFQFSAFQAFYIDLLAGKYPTLAVLLFAGGILAFVGLGRRMLNLSEGNPEYFKNIYFSSRAASQSRGGAAANPPLAKAYGSRWLAWISAPAEGGLRFPRGARPTIWGFVVRRRALEGRQSAFSSMVLLVFLGLLLAALRNPWQNPWQPKPITRFLLPWQGLLVSAFILAISTFKRWPYLQYESLLPLTRGQFLLAQAMMLLWDLAFMWLLAVVALIAVLAVIDPPFFADSAFWLGMLFGVFSGVFSIAVVLWILRSGSLLVCAIIMPILLGIPISGGIFAAKGILSLSPIAIALLLFSELALAAIILADAAHRWMRTELAPTVAGGRRF